MPNDPEVSPLVVVGQRRPGPTFIFPQHSAPNPYLQLMTPEYNPEGTIPTLPCDDPATRAEWDKDAGAADAMKKIKAWLTNQGQQFGHREGTVVVYEGGDGRMHLGELGEGAVGTGAAPWVLNGIPPGSIRGLVHNHPGGSKRPSAADWRVYSTLSVSNPGLRLYIIGPHYTPGNPNPDWRLYIYDESNMAGDDPGPEVNPDAQPC